MAVSEAQKKASVKYLEKLDEVRIRMPKGRKAIIQERAQAMGESVNSFINAAIDREMEKAPVGHVEASTINAGAEVVQLPSETVETAKKAAQSAGETVSQFVGRAVETQAKRDEAARKLGVKPNKEE